MRYYDLAPFTYAWLSYNPHHTAMSKLSTSLIIGIAAITGLGVGALWSNIEGRQAQAQPIAAMASPAPRVFSVCHTGGGTNCVVDGDTVWVDGVKIRVADIDAPETHPPAARAGKIVGPVTRSRDCPMDWAASVFRPARLSLRHSCQSTNEHTRRLNAVINHADSA